MSYYICFVLQNLLACMHCLLFSLMKYHLKAMFSKSFEVYHHHHHHLVLWYFMINDLFAVGNLSPLVEQEAITNKRKNEDAIDELEQADRAPLRENGELRINGIETELKSDRIEDRQPHLDEPPSKSRFHPYPWKLFLVLANSSTSSLSSKVD